MGEPIRLQLVMSTARRGAILAIEDRAIPAGDPTSGFPESGEIVGALGTLKRSEAGQPKSWRRKLRVLLVILGPGLIVMGGGNDAGGVQVYLQWARTTA